jgi:hypothetical protein
MADTSFIEKLRMNNIFPADGSPRTGTPFGMPDLNAGQFDPSSVVGEIYPLIARERQRDRDLQMNLARMKNQPQLNRIAQNAVEPQNVNTPNVVFNPSPTDASQKFANEILNGPSLKEQELNQKYELAQQKSGLEQQKIDINKQRTGILDFKAKNPGMKVLTPKGGNIAFLNPVTGETIDSGIGTGTMTEQELQELRGDQAMQQIGARTEGQKQVQEMRNEGQLANIAARAQNISPTQEKSQIQNNVNKLITTRPDLAEFIVQDPNTGAITVSDKANPTTAQMINDAIYGKKASDINLPSNKKPAVKTETVTTPTASKYKVTVE